MTGLRAPSQLPSSAYAWLRHSPWDGIRVADVVFPLFLFLVGASAAVGRPRPWQRQTRRALTIIQAAIEALGGRLDDVVRTRMFVTDISKWEEVGGVHGEVFAVIRPATTMVVVTATP